jgi:hypothetical protein
MVESLNPRGQTCPVRKHRKLLILLACVAVCAGVAGVVSSVTRDNEPHYQGRSLSEWLNAHYSAPPWRYSTEPGDAIREIGTNAIPYLLKWIRYHPSAFQKTARSKLAPSLLQTRLGRYLSGISAEDRAVRAVIGFSFLDTNAIPAIPHLVAIMRDTTRLEAARSSIGALSLIGTPALPALAAAFSDTNYPLRSEILPYLPYFDGTNSFSSYLKAALVDPDPQVRSAATNALREIEYMDVPAK